MVRALTLVLLLGVAGAPGAGCTGVPTGGGDDDGEGSGEEGFACAPEDEEALAALDPAGLPAGEEVCREPVLVRVDYVADGDTFYFVTPEGGDGEWVRLIGVDTPEVAHPEYGEPEPECYGDEGRDYTEAELGGRLAWLTFDADCIDPYDRTLAYVHLGAGDGCFFQRRLLRDGYAETLTFWETSTHADTFEDDEAWARDRGLGLWSACE